MNLDNLIKNPSKSETYGDVERTIANQMARFTCTFKDTKNPIESLKMVCALGFDLWETCGNRVCEDTNLTLVSLIRKTDSEMAYKFQEIANKLNNNDICVYLYLALPTINNNVSFDKLKGLCYDTIDSISESYKDIAKQRMYITTNFGDIDSNLIKIIH